MTPPDRPGEDWPEQDWTAWADASIDDKVIEPIAAVAEALREAEHKVEFWTGRGENMRRVTEAWLSRHGFCTCVNCTPLRMRPQNEPTLADAILKARYLTDFGKPDLIFEDRASVVEMWRSHGIVCAQVAPGDF